MITLRIANETALRVQLANVHQAIMGMLTAGKKAQLIVKEEKRSNQANALMWAMLTEIAHRVEWHGQKLAKEDWKAMLSASLRKQRVVPNIEGNGFVVLGDSTSQMSVAEMSEMIALIEAFGSERGVRFSAP